MLNVTTTNGTTDELLVHGKINKYIMITLYSLVGCISFISNSLIFLVVGSNKKLWSNSYLLLVSLAVTDWLIIVVGIPVHIANIYLETSIMTGALCQLYGYLIQTVFQCSMFNLSLISFHRYSLYVKRKWYQKIFGGKRVLVVLIVFAWLTPMVITSTPLYGFGRYYYDHSRGHCMIDWLHDYRYIVYVQALVFPPNAILMGFCYIKIIQTIKRRIKAIQNDRRKEEKHQLELYSTYMLLVVLTTSTACFSPYMILLFVEFFMNKRIEQKYGFISLLFCYSNSMFDFIIYNAMNSRFRRCFMKTIAGHCKRGSQVSPSSTNSSETTGKQLRTFNVTNT